MSTEVVCRRGAVFGASGGGACGSVGGACEGNSLARVSADAALEVGSGFEGGGDGLVGADGGCGEVADVAAVAGPDRVGECAVRGDQLVRGRPVVGGRPHQRVAELEPAVRETDERVRLGRFQILQPRTELPGRGDHRFTGAGVFGRGDQEEGAGDRGQTVDPFGEDLVELGGHRVAADVGAETSLRFLEGQCEQRERIARGGIENASPGSGGAATEACGEDRPGGGVVERSDAKFGQPRGREVGGEAVADGEDHGDRLGDDPAGGEQHRFGGVAVDPVRIVDNAEDRLGRGGDGEEIQHRQSEMEQVVGGHVDRRQSERAS